MKLRVPKIPRRNASKAAGSGYEHIGPALVGLATHKVGFDNFGVKDISDAGSEA